MAETKCRVNSLNLCCLGLSCKDSYGFHCSEISNSPALANTHKRAYLPLYLCEDSQLFFHSFARPNPNPNHNIPNPHLNLTSIHTLPKCSHFEEMPSLFWKKKKKSIPVLTRTHTHTHTNAQSTNINTITHYQAPAEIISKI